MRRICLVILAFFVLSCVVNGSSPGYRKVVLDCNLEIKDIPAGISSIRIWMSSPANTSCQITEDITSNNKWLSSVNYDKKYNNKILYYHLKSQNDSLVKIRRTYRIKRYEYSRKTEDDFIQKETIAYSELEKYLLANRLVTLSPRVKSLAREIVKGENATLSRAKALYDYVFDNVSYDKTTPGWGRGDTERVCILQRGNCTDFHSLFISLARANGIPARFITGIQLPKENYSKFKSYHCWAEFYIADFGWIPVDISEAWKKKSKQEYYFGSLDENRIEFTRGRDIILEPRQNGEPLNYFIYPYVEINGMVYENVDVSWKVRQDSEERR